MEDQTEHNTENGSGTEQVGREDEEADLMLALALSEQLELEGGDLTQEELTLQLYQQDIWSEENETSGNEKKERGTQVESKPVANSGEESSREEIDQGQSLIEQLQQLQQQQQEHVPSEFEDEVRLIQSPVGVSWKLVERFILLWHSRPRWNAIISLLARDDVVAMAEKLVLLQQEWKLYPSTSQPTTIDVAFHWTRLENLSSIQEGGLLTKTERDESGINAHHNGSSWGDGVYTASNPFTFYGHYGDVCLMVARMEGTKGPRTRNSRDQVDTVVDDSARMSVLKSSAQCFPIFMFSKDDIHPNDTAFPGNEKINQCHVDVQRILDEFLNDWLETPVQSPYVLNARSHSVPVAAPRPILPRRPLPTRRDAADSNWYQGPLGSSTNLSSANKIT